MVLCWRWSKNHKEGLAADLVDRDGIQVQGIFGELAKHCCMESMDFPRMEKNPSKTSKTYGPSSVHDFDVLGH